MRKINPEILKILRHRFDDQVLEADILSWLYNFDEMDWENALCVLEQVSFYSEDRCCEVYRDQLGRIVDNSQNGQIYILPVGKTGKSGNLVAYWIKKIINSDKNKFKQCIFFSFDNKVHYSTDDQLILLDDYSGSGKSISDFYNKIKAYIPDYIRVSALTVAYMEKAKRNLMSTGINIIGIEHYPAFVKRGSVFGYPPRMRVIRDFAYRYGAYLYPKQTSKKKTDYISPLGYGNSQSLVCFDHTTPNNTLPILWASCMRNDVKQSWQPLFPRFINSRIERGNTYEKKMYYWTSLLHKISVKIRCISRDNYRKDTVRLVGIIHYKHQNKSAAYICNSMGLTIDEYDSLIIEAQTHGYLTADQRLSELGQKTYNEIRSRDKRGVPHLITDTQVEQDVYIPTQFLGLSKDNSISMKSKIEIPVDIL